MVRETLLDYFRTVAELEGEYLVYDDGFRPRAYSYAGLARAAGIGNVHQVESLDQFVVAFRAGLAGGGPTFIHARVEAARKASCGARDRTSC